METIENKVANSGLVTLDMEERKPHWDIVGFDLADVLFQGLVLREKDFRAFVESHDWGQYADKCVHVHCSADAIVPTWAYMLISTRLAGIATVCIFGSANELRTELWRAFVRDLDLSEFASKRVVVKGCSDEEIGPTVYVELTTRLMPVVKSLMFGEPCSTVPLFKRK